MVIAGLGSFLDISRWHWRRHGSVPVWAGATLVVVSAIASFACSPPDGRIRLQEQPPENFLLITIDTLRADRVGSYGHGAARTPALDRLASEGVRFAQALAPTPLTLPAHASLLTGLYPVSHGLHTNGRQRLAEDIPTLAGLLAERLPRRGALVASVSLDSLFGLARGFADYDDRIVGPDSGDPILFQGERRGDEMARLAAEWLSRETRPFFLWVHLFDPHAPYDTPAPWNERVADPYDAEIAFADQAVATILESVSSKGLLERTLVVVAGDHGESLGEHGETNHGIFLYDGAVRVPLLFRYPPVLPAGQVVQGQVRLIDVLPTVLELFGVGVPDGIQGSSLVSVLLGEEVDLGLDAFLETRQPALQYGWSALSGLRTQQWKYIAAPREELYDLEADPREEHNLSARELQVVADLRGRLEQITRALEPAPASSVRIEGELRRQLESLGYIGGRSSEEPGVVGADPKDRVDLLPRMTLATEAYEAQRYGESVPALEAILDEDPPNVFCRRLLARSLLGLGRVEDGERQYAKLLEWAPDDAEALNTLGTISLRQGRFAEAERYLGAAAEVSPWDPRIQSNRAFLLVQRGNLDGAESVLRRILDEHPRLVEAALNLAGLQRRRGKSGAAEATLRKYLRRVPGEPAVVRALAGLLRELGRDGEASQLLEGTLAKPDS